MSLAFPNYRQQRQPRLTLTEPEVTLDLDEFISSMSDDELKDIVITRNRYGGRIITAARKELEKRNIKLSDSEQKQLEANKKARITDAKLNGENRILDKNK